MFNFKTKISKYLGLICIFSLLSPSLGCANFSSYMSLALQFALNAAQIYAVASGHPVSTATIAQWQAKEQDIVKLEAGFIKGTTSIADVNAAIADFQSNISSVFDLASIKNPTTQNMISAILGLVNTNIQLAETLFAPSSSTTIVSAAKTSSVAVEKVVTVGNMPKKALPSIAQLKRQYNTIVSVDTNDVLVNNIAHNSTF